jgi:hypothetical protein
MRPALLVLVLALSLVACSSSTGGSGTAPTVTAPTHTTPTHSISSAPSVAPSVAPLSSPLSSPTSSSLSSPLPSSAPSGTRTSVLRPVRADGQVAPGWNVTNESEPVRCSPGESSPAAVDSGIGYCSPSAAYAIACWRAADRAHALCLHDAQTRTLGRLPLEGSFAPVTAPRVSVPFDVVLDNNVHCTIRDGGAASNLTNHPDWIPFYYCEHDTAVYGPSGGIGINRSSATWTVQLGSSSGESDTTTHRVVTASFVGTAGS